MLLRLLKDTLQRRMRRLLATTLAVMTGAALAAALLDVSLGITGRLGRELRAYGANILVQPAAGALRLEIGGVPVRVQGGGEGAERPLLDENELARLKTIFWRNNIVGFVPYLSVPAEVDGQILPLTGTWFDKPLTLPGGVAAFRTGVKAVAPWWRVQGAWVRDDDAVSAMVGAGLAARRNWRVGDRLLARVKGREAGFRIAGLVDAGGFEDDQMFVSLPAVQELLGVKRGADRVQVSALVEPDSSLRADLRGLDPERMTSEQYETWYCSPIMGAVLAQIEEALPGAEARPIRQICQAEMDLLGKIGLFFAFLTLTALGGSVLAVMTAMTASVMERRTEIGLMKAVGADGGQIALIFLSEASAIGLAGGGAGYLAGWGLARGLEFWVFARGSETSPLVLPFTLLLALAVVLAGSALPVLKAARLEPVRLLKGT